MDNAQKAIMLGVGLFITIIVIAAVMAITGIGQDLISSGQGQLSGISSQLASQIKSSYDQVKMTGSQVRTAVNKYYNDDGVALYLVADKTANQEALKGIQFTTTSYTQTVDNQGTITQGTGTVSNPFLCSATMISPANGATISVDGDGINLKGMTITNGYLENPSSRPTLAQITSAISSSGKYKSALITNEATSEIIGIIIVRYQ